METEKREFNQFCKHFMLRTIQVIVQSRHGRKIRTPSRVITQNRDWFNLNIEEIPEINEEVDRSLGGFHHIPHVDGVNVLISLRTSDGEMLHLEIWRILLEPDQTTENTPYARTQLYHRMSVLLRSAIVASRTTPAYKLYARRQSSESFVLCYEISRGPPQIALLGFGAKNADLGYVVSQFGNLRLSLHYRTQMVISNDPSDKLNVNQNVNENYFKPNLEAANRKPVDEQQLEVQSSNADVSIKPTTDLGCSPSREIIQQPCHFKEIGPWQPLAEPSPSKVSSVGSPCYNFFSTSPGSADFNPCSPSSFRKTSIAFQLGATSGSSSEEGGSLHHLQSSGAVVPFGMQHSGGDYKRNSSSGIFRLDISDVAGTSSKPSSVPDCFGRGRSSSSVAKRDSFPFSRLLPSCSAPAFGNVVSVGGNVGVVCPRGSQQLATLMRSPKRCVIEEEQVGTSVTGCEGTNLEDSREITTLDGVKIYEKRKKNTKKKKYVKNADGTLDQMASDSDDSSSSNDFVEIEIRRAFGSPSHADASMILSQIKSAPPQLRSFQNVPCTQGGFAAAGSDTQGKSIENIAAQLKEFEEKQKLYDDFVKSLCSRRVDTSSEGEND